MPFLTDDEVKKLRVHLAIFISSESGTHRSAVPACKLKVLGLSCRLRKAPPGALPTTRNSNGHCLFGKVISISEFVTLPLIALNNNLGRIMI